MENKGTLDKRKVIIVSVVILFILVIAIYTIIHLVQNQSNVAVVTNGVLSQEENVNGYIVRDETVVKGKNYKNGMVKIKSEGEKSCQGRLYIQILFFWRGRHKRQNKETRC